MRAILSPEELEATAQRLLAMTTADTVRIDLDQRVQGITRIQANRVHANTDGSTLHLRLQTEVGGHGSVVFDTDRIDDASLRQAVGYTERASRESRGFPLPVNLRMRTRRHAIPPGTVYHESTLAALGTSRYDALPTLMQPVIQAQLVASAFVGAVARSTVVLTKDGVSVSGHETDAEITVSAWTKDQTGEGWAGQAARDWRQLEPAAIAERASALALQCASPIAVEPGRRTVILGPAAVAQFARLMPYAWAAVPTLFQRTPFFGGTGDGGTKLGERVMDSRVTITSDPADPEGGVLPFYADGRDNSAVVPMTWVKDGILQNLAFDPESAARFGVHPASGVPESMRLGQGTATVEELIAQCADGIYVNRVANLVLRDARSGVMSGVTQGGCLLIKNGKVTKGVKNLRFVESPFVFLKNFIEIGVSHRAALGYVPPAGNASDGQATETWPLPPVIVPPLMVRDFNFTMLADAV